MVYSAAKDRYASMRYNRCGKSGLKLPALSLGFWHNFGSINVFENSRAMALHAFDLGITHFDLANNYGPEPGSAEETFGKIIAHDLRPYRDEMVISTKAGFRMWEGPYGEWGSRKYLLASLDQSLKRLGLDYVDIFYSHRPDPETPLAETMGALASAVKQGKALYAGISSYTPAQTRECAKLLRDMGTPCLIHQQSYSMLNRVAEEGLFAALGEEGIGCIVFSPLAQGLLTDKYLHGIPEGSRAARKQGRFSYQALPEKAVAVAGRLNVVAERRGQTLAQMALLWTQRIPQVCSTLIGTHSIAQMDDNLKALSGPAFSAEELAEIDAILETLKN